MEMLLRFSRWSILPLAISWNVYGGWVWASYWLKHAVSGSRWQLECLTMAGKPFRPEGLATGVRTHRKTHQVSRATLDQVGIRRSVPRAYRHACPIRGRQTVGWTVDDKYGTVARPSEPSPVIQQQAGSFPQGYVLRPRHCYMLEKALWAMDLVGVVRDVVNCSQTCNKTHVFEIMFVAVFQMSVKTSLSALNFTALGKGGGSKCASPP